MKPITPEEALKQKIEAMPDCIISEVNKMIVENMSVIQSYYVTLKLKEVEPRLKQVTKALEIKWDKSYLDFEPIFREAGWNVEYKQSGYGDSDFDAYYKFSKKSK